MKLLKCNLCGNLLLVLHDSGNPPSCCGQRMNIVTTNTTDGAMEKHVPVVCKDGDKVTVCVGSEAHPMTEKHYIEWIAIETNQGIHFQSLTPTDKPEACFDLTCHEELIKAYAYCNLHELWQST